VKGRFFVASWFIFLFVVMALAMLAPRQPVRPPAHCRFRIEGQLSCPALTPALRPTLSK
jgi:hypothetical protein